MRYFFTRLLAKDLLLDMKTPLTSSDSCKFRHHLRQHSLSTTTTGVSFEAEGGIRNPACQDDDSTDNKLQSQQRATTAQQQQQQREAEDGRFTARRIVDNESYKIHEKSPKIGPVMTVCRTRMPWRFSANFFIAIIVSLIMLFGELGWIPNQKVGFYCNDPKISFKFTGDSISMATLLIVSIVVPALVIWAVEWSYYSPDSYKSLECGSSSRSRQFWVWYGYYSLGWWYLIFIVEVIKVVVGEPRPHFFDSCRPKEISNCTSDEFKSFYTCTNTEISWFYVNDSDKSFPSGHSALSIFTATFLIWYLQCRMPNRLVLLLVKPWLQCLAVLWGLGCSMSRITDNRHHWWDVAAGSVLGLLFGVFTVRVLCKCFDPSRQQLQATHAMEANGGGGGGGVANLSSSSSSSVPANGSLGGYANSKRHQSIKKLLSTSSSIDMPDSREMGDVGHTWTA